MVENTRLLSLENLKNFQERKIVTQNKAQNVVEERIPIGKTVFLKCEGLLNKLKPRFKGLYKVSGYTRLGNYIVNKALNVTLKDTYPRHKVKEV
jgi:hypothetical protein